MLSLHTRLGSGGIGALTGGVTGGLFGGLDALDKNTNFWTGNAHLDPNGAYSCAEMDPEGLLNKLKEKSEKIIGKYVGVYEDQHVFETPILGTYSDQGGYSGITFPDRGIFVGKGVFTGSSENGRAMMQHEFGHILQYRIVGSKSYYTVIAKESALNCKKVWPYNKTPHDNFWTETWANYLAKQHFGVTWHGTDIY